MTSADAQEQYQRLVSLAYADLHRQGFTEEQVMRFLEERCAVPDALRLGVRPWASAEEAHHDPVTWVQALAFAQAQVWDAVAAEHE